MTEGNVFYDGREVPAGKCVLVRFGRRDLELHMFQAKVGPGWVLVFCDRLPEDRGKPEGPALSTAADDDILARARVALEFPSWDALETMTDAVRECADIALGGGRPW